MLTVNSLTITPREARIAYLVIYDVVIYIYFINNNKSEVNFVRSIENVEARSLDSHEIL